MSATKGLSRKKGKVSRERPKDGKVVPSKVKPALPELKPTLEPVNRKLLAAGTAIFAAGLWSYWATICELVGVWYSEPDYSHGFLIVPLAVGLLWLRRDQCPGVKSGSPMIGLTMFAVSLVLRYLDTRYYLRFLEMGSILIWIASVVATMGGVRLLAWCLPAIGFLAFMIPLPFSLEGAFSYPLQRIATKISCWTLQLFGQPAFAEGNVIHVGNNTLEVAQACSGLRLFVSISALAYAYVAMVRRPWWEKLLLVLAVIPVAIVSNSARIVATGLLYQITSSESIRKMAHDSAGWGMIVLATALFWLVLKYLKLLVREQEIMDVADLMRTHKGSRP